MWKKKSFAIIAVFHYDWDTEEIGQEMADRMEESTSSAPLFERLLKAALVGDVRGAASVGRRYVRELQQKDPARAAEMAKIIKDARPPSEAFREAPGRVVPVDRESRHELLRIVHPNDGEEPILPTDLAADVEQIILERSQAKVLADAGLEPTKSVLMTGVPGIGKTMTATWIAHKLKKRLFILDLASVMSSYLGRTGSNLKSVLEFAKAEDGVLLLDEFDAIGKRRDDDSEVGELKRLVTVLLQEVDQWPSDRLLIAATNHGELLDPAVWRRFDVVLKFPEPDRDLMARLLSKEVGEFGDPAWAAALAFALPNYSYAEALNALRRSLRNAIVHGIDTEEALKHSVLSSNQNLSKDEKKVLARALHRLGFSQRSVHDVTGLARETLRSLELDWRGRRG